MFAWDTHFYIGMLILIIKMGKISLLHGVPIFTVGCLFTVKMGTQVPIITLQFLAQIYKLNLCYLNLPLWLFCT